MINNVYDSIFENKIGFGRYQHIAIGISGLIHFTDGSDIMASSLIIPVLQTEWELSTTLQGLMGFIFFGGIFAGSSISGQFADKYGRQKTLLYVAIAQAIAAIALSLSPGIGTFAVLRGIFGILVGIMIPLGPALVSEISSISMRGKMTVIANTFFTLGTLFSVFMAMISLTTLKSGNWRLLIFLSSVPTYLLIWTTYKHLKESPRFLIANGHLDEGVDVLNHIGTTNNPSMEQISEQEKEDLNKWRLEVFSQEVQPSVRVLFSPRNIRITLLLWTIWTCLNYFFYGITFILPYMLTDLNPGNVQKKGIVDVMITVLAQLPSCVVAYFLIEKEFAGRRKTIICANLLGALLYIFMYSQQGDGLVTFTSVVKFMGQLTFNILFPYTAELYLTTVRVVGIGWSNGFGKFGASLSPSISLGLYKVNMFLPLLSYAFASGVVAVCAYFIQQETRGKVLDTTEGTQDQEMTDRYNILRDEEKR